MNIHPTRSPILHSCWFAAAACLLMSAMPVSAARTMKAIFVQPPAGVPEKAVLVVAGTGKTLDIELPHRNLSPAVEIPTGELVMAVLAEKPTDQEIPPAAPKIKIPESWTDCILLFFHDPDNRIFPARVIPVNASTADFPLGDTVIFNVSPATVQGKFGSKVVRVNPGQFVPVKPPREGSGDYPVVIECAMPGDTKPTVLCRSTWQHEADARQILFVTPLSGQKIPRIWGIIDRPDPESRKMGQ